MAPIKSLLFSDRDDLLVEVAAGGQKFSASTRLITFVCIWICISIFSLISSVPLVEVKAIFFASSSALIIAIIYFFIVRSDHIHPAAPFIVSLSDILIISAALMYIALSGRPEITVNSMVLWETYLLFIIASSLHFDIRVCIATGLTALFLYIGIILWVLTNFTLPETQGIRWVYIGFSWHVQSGRLIVMFVAMLIAIGIVVRSRNLLTISGTDTLTGMANRRVFEAHLSQELSRSKRHVLNFSLVYLDLDDFKTVNSNWGHEQGDHLLQLVAKVISENTRSEDIAARWGGEEFILLYPNTGKASAKHFIERLNSILKQQKLPFDNTKKDGEKFELSFSAGVSEYPFDGIEKSNLIRIADNRLHYAKEQGKNCVVIEDMKGN